jgi:hypothetical protein
VHKVKYNNHTCGRWSDMPVSTHTRQNQASPATLLQGSAAVCCSCRVPAAGQQEQLPQNLHRPLLRTTGSWRDESACLRGSVHTRSRMSSSPHRYCSRRMYLAMSGAGVPHTGWGRAACEVAAAWAPAARTVLLTLRYLQAEVPLAWYNLTFSRLPTATTPCSCAVCSA